uniref:Putative ovule protein n=1 Tax=Solanum chacoense TaxID=4108 RepID=A0A0V0HYJ8_SOLCH
MTGEVRCFEPRRSLWPIPEPKSRIFFFPFLHSIFLISDISRKRNPFLGENGCLFVPLSLIIGFSSSFFVSASYIHSVIGMIV